MLELELPIPRPIAIALSVLFTAGLSMVPPLQAQTQQPAPTPTDRPPLIGPSLPMTTVPQMHGHQSEEGDPLPPDHPMPEAAIYRIFMTHVATFEQKARDAEAQGKSGDSWRNHLTRKYGLTREEQQQLASTVLSYHSQMVGLRQQLRQEKANFEAKYTLNHQLNRSNPPPAPNEKMHALKQQQDALTLNTKDQIHAQLGDARFAELDDKVHNQITRIAARQHQ